MQAKPSDTFRDDSAGGAVEEGLWEGKAATKATAGERGGTSDAQEKIRRGRTPRQMTERSLYGLLLDRDTHLYARTDTVTGAGAGAEADTDTSTDTDTQTDTKASALTGCARMRQLADLLLSLELSGARLDEDEGSGRDGVRHRVRGGGQGLILPVDDVARESTGKEWEAGFKGCKEGGECKGSDVSLAPSSAWPSPYYAQRLSSLCLPPRCLRVSLHTHNASASLTRKTLCAAQGPSESSGAE